MKEAEIQGVSARKWRRTTLRAEDARPALDLVDRDFTATGPNQLWVADITYVPTWAGFLFLAIVLDVWSRRIVGWMATHLRTELVVEALDMAPEQRGPRGVIHHSDQGCLPRSVAFGKRCERAGVSISMGSVGDAYDNPRRRHSALDYLSPANFEAKNWPESVGPAAVSRQGVLIASQYSGL